MNKFLLSIVMVAAFAVNAGAAGWDSVSDWYKPYFPVRIVHPPIVEEAAEDEGGGEPPAVSYTLHAPWEAPGGSDGVGSNSYDFIAANADIIRIDDHDDFSFGNGSTDSPFSVCFWADFDNVDISFAYMTKGDASKQEWEWYYEAGLTFLLVDDSTGTGYEGRKTSAYLAGDGFSNSYHHICGTYDGTGGTGADGGIDIYVNGIVDDQTSIGTGYTSMHNGTSDLYFGDLPRAAGNWYFDGQLTKILITSDVLTADEVELIMGGDNCADYNTLVNNVVSCWDLDTDKDADIGGPYTETVGNVPDLSSPAHYPGDGTNPWGNLRNTMVIDADELGVDDGSITLRDTSTGYIHINQGDLILEGSGNYTHTCVNSTSSYTNATGLTLFSSMKANTLSGTVLGFDNNTTCGSVASTGFDYMFYTNTQDIQVCEQSLNCYTVYVGANDTLYETAIILGGFDSSGDPYQTGDTVADFKYAAYYFIKAGANWELVYYGPMDTHTFQWKDNQYVMANYAQNASEFEVGRLSVPVDTLESVFDTALEGFDTFTGTNGQTVESGGTYSGTERNMGSDTTWHKRTDECAGGSGDSVWQIDTNTLEFSTTGTNCTYNGGARYLYQTASTADGIIEANIDCKNTDTTYYAGLYIRGAAEGAAGINGYDFRLRGDGSFCDPYLVKYTNGSTATVYSNTSATYGAGYHNVKAAFEDENWYLFIDGAGVWDGTSADHKTNTRHGLFRVYADDQDYQDFAFRPRGTGGEYSALDDY